ncbi:MULTISPECIES: TetR/AcrR family transcriptional regulator [Amycolatopsis]|uniref:TetR/AcrR family transcriptional regulator n=1 Tax=Amycolatopsis thermalba TaxID=944492 RepID=A0ABY4NSL8_9PSEU|nr:MULTISPECIES: TetR/AcrR family transcriptional regulator [Amycolatopsis]OXM69224.1 TetR family transcriptional regulator [Amycolatopsis sp. KNN50.9b]UQS23046.1 TetR/AcrR family transcriptional regulator [Amycolatopsis thermalba]
MTAPRPMRADARRNYERILNTAREAFLEHGPDAPLDDIARRAGVGAGTLYRHFPTRETLVEAVYRDDIERLSAAAHRLLAEYEPSEALNRWMREQVAFVLHKRGLAATLKAAMDRDSDTFALCKAMMNEAAAAVLKPAQETGAVRADVRPRDLLLLGHGVSIAAEGNDETAERLLTVMLDGLRQPKT